MRLSRGKENVLSVLRRVQVPVREAAGEALQILSQHDGLHFCQIGVVLTKQRFQFVEISNAIQFRWLRDDVPDLFAFKCPHKGLGPCPL